MPQHTFKCNECNKEFNITLKITDDVKSKCEYCNSDNTEKIFKAGISFIPCDGMHIKDYN